MGVLGLRCCGIRCASDRQVRASWRAREDMTGIILHRDCLVDHSPRRTLAMLHNLTHQTSVHHMSPTLAASHRPLNCTLSTNIEMESSNGTKQPNLQEFQTAQDVIEPPLVVSDNEGTDSKAVEDTTHSAQDMSTHTVSVEIHEQSQL